MHWLGLVLVIIVTSARIPQRNSDSARQQRNKQALTGMRAARYSNDAPAALPHSLLATTNTVHKQRALKALCDDDCSWFSIEHNADQ